MTDATTPFWRHDFWPRWVVANAVGELAGLGTVACVGFLVVRHYGQPSGTAETLGFAGLAIVLGAFEGLVVGLAQRQVLRTLLPAVEGWVRATVVGALVAWTVGMVPSTLVKLGKDGAGGGPAPAEPPILLILALAAAMGAVAGPLLALFQWLSLRKVIRRRAWLWLPANGAAWGLAMPVIFAGAQANELSGNPAVIAALVALAIFAAGAVAGAVHGRVLMALAARTTPG